MMTLTEIRSGAYYDSVVLMQLQRKLAELDGVDDAGVVMGTPANKELLADFDLLSDEAQAAGADDLVIIVRADSVSSAQAALGQVDELLKARRSTISEAYRPHTLKLAAEQLPGANWVLISVPGRYAAGVAEQALDLGKHVFLYSDNVSLEDEIRLKRKGVEHGLLVMGPDCGTAIINGIGLGFANRVRRGRIGIIAASGTGLQMVSSEIHNRGAGVSQGIGTGGRDLKAEVGARTMLLALQALADDPDTDVIVLVSKPPAASVAAHILAAARACGKPVVVDFIGYPPPARQLGSLHFAASLEDAAAIAVELAADPATSSGGAQPRDGYLRGLFSGGTLAYEAMLGLQTVLDPLYSNVPIRDEQKLADPLASQAHTVVDLGEDEFTQGRLHPMMDNDLRLRRLKEEAADPETGVLLLDVVLGEGAHADPASELAPAIADALKARSDLEALVLVVGTDEDPQDKAAQIAAFEQSGATVFTHMQTLIEHIATRLGHAPQATGRAPDPAQFSGELAAINVGVETFFHSLKAQEAAVVQVDWRPPAGGNEDLMDILARFKA